MGEHLVFVYGTLLRGMRNHDRMEGAVLLGEFKTVKKYRMTAGNYHDTLYAVPYVDPSRPTHHIRGEVYLIDDELLATLDRFEGHPRFYVRKEIAVYNHGGHILHVWIYFNGNTKGHYLVRGGDFVRFIDNHWNNEL